jgi:methyl-accepting chemotaxis protein
MSLKNKFRVIVGVAAAGLLVLAGFWLRSERSRIMREKQEKAQSLVEVPYSVLVRYQVSEQKGELSRAEAQQRALEVIKAMRYEGENYFWINDLHPTMVMHPMKPQLDGKDLSDLKDPKGKALFVEMAEVVRKSGAGFVSYMWPKPGQDKDKPVAKLSFVKGFEPWGWVIGTGIYIDDVDAAWRESATKAGGLALLCLVALLLISGSVSRSIFRRLGHMVERIKDVAQGEGDLTKRIEIDSDDEVAELAKWFNTFMDKLHQMISQLADNTRALTTSSEEISKSSQEQSHGAKMQSEQTTQVATAMQEMASTVQQVSENSENAANASQKAAAAAREGGKIVEETLSRMRAIADSVGDSAHKVQELGKRSDEIGQIISVIDDIADQTNLLALNAAIEAARAGEQGRGFAVVADEVRKLAERTSQATKQITDMIGSIQAETKSAVTAMHAGTKEVETGVESTSHAGQSLREIIQMSEQVGDMIAHIATAATQQSAATEQINGSIEQIARITASTATAAQQTTGAFEDLSGLARDLQQLVGQFRLSSNGHGGNGHAANGHGGNGHSQAYAVANEGNGAGKSLDFNRVKMAHRSWRLRLRSYLDGRENLDLKKLASHRDCELGKWIYAHAMSEYGHLHEVQTLEKKHHGMHDLVKQVVELKEAGKTQEAEQQFASVHKAAEEVVGLLTKVESQVK